MKLPRDLRGADLIKALCRDWGYRQVHQVGSHVILETDSPAHQRIAVPAHPTLRLGTLNAIVRAVAQHKAVSRDKLLQSLR
jgi:predicted RNA binding protein YcfA (HicA-like mRNA interferase family)